MKTNGPSRHWRTVALVLVVLALAGLPMYAQEGPPATLNVQANAGATGVRLDLHASGPFDYTTLRSSETLYIVEMSGVELDGSGSPRVLNSDVVSSYRLLPYRSMGRSMVRLEVLMRKPVGPRVERISPSELAVSFDEPGSPVPAAHLQAAVMNPSKSASVSESVPSSHSGEVHGARIERVTLARANDDVIVRVEADGKLNYQVLRLAKPERLVLDFEGATVGRVQKPASVVDPVAGIRAAQFKPEMARVVIDLDHAASYHVSATNSGLEITFGSGASKPIARKEEVSRPAPVEKQKVQEAVPAPAETHVVAAPAAAEPNEAASVPAPAPAPAREEATNFANPAVMVDSSAMPLPKTLTGESSALASPRADGVSSAPSPAVVPVARRAEAQPVDSTQSAAASSAGGPGPAQKKYTGEPISVNLKDVDLKDFFRLIHEISGLNVVLDPAVRGNLTLVLDDVPWDQALDIVLQNNGLDKQLQGNVLRIATRETLKREAEQQRDLAKAQNEAVPAVTATRVLNYAKASVVRDTLKRFLSSRGDILADDRANLLIIRDIPSVFPDLDALIKTLDRKSQQVEIEARVVSATRTFSREIGTQFGFSATAVNGKNLFGGLPGNPLFVSPVTHPIAPPFTVSSGSGNVMPLVTNLPALTPNTGFTYAFSSPNVAIDMIISAAESRGVGKLLSRPKIVTQNNQAATVKQGTKIPVQTVINNTISTEFIDAVLRLQVTPQITADGTIFMDVDVENTQIDNGIPRVMGIPALDTQEAQTKVLVADGGTVVIGGVIISQQQTTVDQTPFLGSIPVIGHLFRHTTVNTQSQELLFFLTPRIIPT